MDEYAICVLAVGCTEPIKDDMNTVIKPTRITNTFTYKILSHMGNVRINRKTPKCTDNDP
jgi:hypothetical protein